MLKATKLFPLAFTCVAAAACGSSSSSGSANGIANESAAQIAHDVSKAIDAATSLHMSGSGSSNGSRFALDATIVPPSGLSGDFTLNGKGSFKLVTNDGKTFYMTPDHEFWTNYGGSNPAVLQLLNGKCILATDSSVGFGSLSAGFSSFANIRQLFSTALDNASGLTKEGVSTVDGQQVVKIKAADGSELSVATDGSPLPVEFSKSGSEGGSVKFDHWNAAGPISAPSGCIDFSKLAQSFPTPTP